MQRRRKVQQSKPGPSRLVAYAALLILVVAFFAVIELFGYGYLQISTANFLLTALLSLFFLV
ncbi:MAG: hypothetical protein QW719_03160, partial [Candidatus Micrarchaeaceae archaeon]